MDNKLREERILIARFMTYEPEVLEKDLLKAGCVESMQYDSDWNWIMPVVERIEDKYAYRYYDDGLMHSITECWIIENIYKACIEFIGWYNRDKIS